MSAVCAVDAARASSSLATAAGCDHGGSGGLLRKPPLTNGCLYVLLAPTLHVAGKPPRPIKASGSDRGVCHLGFPHGAVRADIRPLYLQLVEGAPVACTSGAAR